MTTHFNGSKAKELYYDGSKIKEAWYNGEKVYSGLKSEAFSGNIRESTSNYYYCYIPFNFLAGKRYIITVNGDVGNNAYQILTTSGTGMFPSRLEYIYNGSAISVPISFNFNCTKNASYMMVQSKTKGKNFYGTIQYEE